MDRSIEIELRQGIEKVSEKVTNNHTEINDKLSDINESIKALTIKQNVGAWILKTIGMVVISSAFGLFGGSFRH